MRRYDRKAELQWLLICAGEFIARKTARLELSTKHGHIAIGRKKIVNGIKWGID